MEKENTNSYQTLCESCPFADKSEEDVDNYLRRYIEDYINDRKLTYDEVDRLGKLVDGMLEDAIDTHKTRCPLKNRINALERRLEKKEAHQAGEEEASKDNKKDVKLATTVVIGIAAFTSMILSLLQVLGIA